MKRTSALKGLCGQFVALLLLAAATTSSAWARGEESVVSLNDSDGDRVVDTVDVDDDNDGILDVVEIANNGLDVDSDLDGIPDRLDLDSDNDGVLDWIESGAVFSIDFSELRVVSGRILGPVGENGLHDAIETFADSGVVNYSIANMDVADDDLPDVIDLDSDNDGIPDLIEAGIDPSFDSDGDARIDISAGSVGSDGIADRLQKVNDETCCDANDDGIEDTVPRNTDEGDFPDFRDLDSDNDGVFDIVEVGGTDFNNDGRIDNFFDSPIIDGMDDALLVIPVNYVDQNGNGVEDHIDPFAQAGNAAPVEPASNVADDDPQPNNGPVQLEPTENANVPNNSTSGNADSTNVDLVSGSRDPAQRPGTNVLNEPLDDGAGTGEVLTGLNASGCSVQSTGTDFLLLLLSVLSIAVLGWRYTVKRLRH